MKRIDKLRSYLQWLITPQTRPEQERFMQEGLVDDYIKMRDKIMEMNEEELIKEINTQLKPFELEINDTAK